MTSLPMNLYKDCQTVLAKCSEFDNLNSLKSIFVVVELEPFKNDLPEGVSKQDRVSKTIDHLLNAASKATESVLLIFLEVLISRRSEGDQLREDLRNLKRNIASWFAKYVEIEIPVVSFAMPQDEAEEIINEKVFSNPSVAPVALSKFHELCKSLKEYGITDLRMLYGKRREDWKIEYRESNNTVENVVINTMNCINNKYRIPGGLTLIRPKFESIDFLDPPKRDETESRLRRSGCMAMIIISAGRGAMNRAPTSAMAQTMIMAGCMVIADAISLFHPLLNEALLQSAIVANERVAIFIHNPINSQSIEINDIIKKHVNEKVRLAFDRFDTQLDKLCEFGLGGVLTLRRWLNAVVPDMEKFVNPREDNRQSMCEIEGNPRGVGQLFYPLGRENVRS